MIAGAIAFVRSALFALLFYSFSALVVSVGALVMLVDRRAAAPTARLWSLGHAWLARHVLGIRTRIIGTLPQSDAIVAFRHESMFETIEVLRLFDRPAVFMKSELRRIPLWGWIAATNGAIFVERDAGATALRTMLTEAKAAHAAGRPLIIFPEGTRMPSGVPGEIMPGIAGIYKVLRLPIVPVALDTGRLAPRRAFRKRAGLVTYLVGEPIPPGLPREAMEAALKAGINAPTGNAALQQKP